MWKTRIDLTGQHFGRWTVKEFADIKHNKARWLCVCSCGKEKTIVGSELRGHQTQSCGCLRKELYKTQIGPLCRNWKNGRLRRTDGYIYIMAKDHPRAEKDGYVLEHILVVEKGLGISLSRKQIVHHINGIRDDNRLDNLFVFQSLADHLSYHRKLQRTASDMQL